MLDIEKIREYLEDKSKETKIYIGCDSERVKVNGIWYADYMVVFIVHIDGKHGCKLFGEVIRERDFDSKKDKPRLRLMNEVYKVSEAYLKFSDILDDREVEVHLDINPKDEYGSSCVVKEAIGYIRGTCNVTPKVKPHGWAASHAADRYKGLKLVA